MSNLQNLHRPSPASVVEPIELDLDGEGARGESVTLPLNGLSDRLAVVCRNANLGIPAVLSGAFTAMLSRLTGARDFVVRVRGEKGELVPLQVAVDQSRPFSQHVVKTAQALENLLQRHSNAPEEEGDARELESAWPIFWSGDDFKESWGESLSVVVDNNFNVTCAARARTERAHVLNELTGAYRRVIEQVIENWDLCLDHLQLVCGQERRRLLVDFNTTETQFQSQTIQEIFEHQVETNSDQLAVHDGKASLSYAQLNRRANQLAHRLRKLGVERNAICGILLPRSVNWCIALLGILKAGGAFVSFDPSHPRDRLRFMAQDSGGRFVVCQDTSPFDQDIVPVDIDDPTLESESSDNPVNVNAVTDLAYVIYTSGTTGTPKGVLLCHEGIASFDKHYKQSFGFAREDRILGFFSPSFDGSISEFTMALLAGTSFYILPEDVKSSHRSFEQYLKEHRITVATIPPPYLSYLDPDAFPTLHTIFVAGSESTRKLLEQWTGKVSIVNHYGPTEVTICATEWKAPRGPLTSPTVPIGQPIANKKVYIVSPDGELQPAGVRGELCVSGIRLSPGYLNRPELTVERFVSNPFVMELPKDQRERHDIYYRTGDWARWLPDGTIEFLGRMDNQVKIRGFRVEIGEVEQAMLGTPGVNEAASISRQDDAGDNTLYGFFAGTASAEDVRAHVAGRVPDYMVPSRMVKVEKMPLTRNDKVDKKRLLAILDESSGSNASEAEVPTLCDGDDEVTQNVLGFIAASSEGAAAVGRIKWNDNLEHLGINSLKFIKLMMKIEERYGLEFEGEFFVGRKELTVRALVAETQKRVVVP